MIPANSEKELAYLHDLFVSNDWDERFASLIDEHVELPQQGLAAYLGVGTGGHALALQGRAGEKLRVVGIDENPENIELAKAKAAVVQRRIEFRVDNLEHLSDPDNHFELVLGNGSLVPIARLTGMLEEMIRIAKPSAAVALVLPTASSFGEFFSVYWEALHNCGLLDHEADVEGLITQLPTISDLEELAKQEGLEQITSSLTREEFDFDSGEAFLNAPLISEFLMKEWLASIQDESRERVSAEIARIINEDRHEAEFALTVKATIITGQKSRGK